MFVETPHLDEKYRGYNPDFVERIWQRRRERRAQERRAWTEKRKREKPKEPKPQAPPIRESVEAWKRATALKRVVAPKWVKDIVIECCGKHDLEIIEVIFKSRRGKCSQCRQEIMWRLRHHEPKPSFPMIGRWLNVDHTTVIHGVRKHQAMLDAQGNS